MGNITACIRRSREVVHSSGTAESDSECPVYPFAPNEGVMEKGKRKCTSDERPVQVEHSTSSKLSTSVEQQIEHSKSHWSQVADYCDSDDERVAEIDNVEVFKDLQRHPIWGGSFFITFGYDLGIWGSFGELELGSKFAEGGQAEIFHAKVTWRDPEVNKLNLDEEIEYVLKVFKKGTFLRQLRTQWPQGMFLQHLESVEHIDSTTEAKLVFEMQVSHAILLRDGRFAFLMRKTQEDLRSLIDRKMRMRVGQDCGPFSDDVAKAIIYNAALGMESLHNHNIIHRDVKASNVLVFKYSSEDIGSEYLMADYESSIGVIGTGFFRAPEILQACKDKTIHQRPELFTKESDVYSFGMMCYEILTGKLPFEGHSLSNYDIALNGQGLELPDYVDEWARGLLGRCLHPNPSARPSIGDIANYVVASSIETFIDFRERMKLLKLSLR
ncbi:hypothetical protein M758_2G016900 [Ceratodon purpureus]|nr:hypothetical protein M758_2G016900 [Ceratodon purpureus]KAG0624961.1 hypothetical protein M758_2G016900 [Ceratodon purpureus]KAG0624962.1 hypothetical protein M758_2G016900 [Ceratodon purpureus]